MAKKSIVLLIIVSCIQLIFSKEHFDCTQLEDIYEEQEALELISQGLEAGNSFTETCLQILINKNLLASTKYLVENGFEDSMGELVHLLRRFITEIRDKQDEILELANSKGQTLSLAPAFQWAQDLNSVAISIKFAHRLDSPSCLDIYNQNVTILEDRIMVSCMCKRNDGIHKYTLDHELFDKINTTASLHEFQSAGRLYLNLTKQEQPKRWRRLLKTEEKIGNMRIWWELHEKHMESLEQHTTFETDDAFEDLVHIGKPKKSKGKKKGKKKRRDDDENEDL